MGEKLENVLLMNQADGFINGEQKRHETEPVFGRVFA